MTVASTADGTVQGSGPAGARALSPIQEQDLNIDSVDKPSNADSAKEEVETHIIDCHRDSDMFMVVKEKNRITKFKVSTCSVATASPHWRTLLYGQKRASNEVWSITLDSSPTALDTLFRIVHYEFAKVPTALTVTQLFELSRATSQYGCTQLTYPWIRNWLACCDDLKATAENFDKCHVGIYIAWEFGCLRLFREMTDALIVSTRINDNGDPVNVNGLRLKDMVLPTGLLDTILETRVSTLANMLAAIAKPMQVLSSDERDPAIKYCRVKAHSVECEDQMFGGTMRVLMNKRLNPIPDASTYSGSIMELKKVAEGIKTNPYVGKDWMPHLSHEKCSLRFAEAMEECLKKMPVALHDEYLEHLSNQAYLSGVENGSDMEDYRRRTSDKATSVAPSESADKAGSVASDFEDGPENTQQSEDVTPSGGTPSSSGSPLPVHRFQFNVPSSDTDDETAGGLARSSKVDDATSAVAKKKDETPRDEEKASTISAGEDEETPVTPKMKEADSSVITDQGTAGPDTAKEQEADKDAFVKKEPDETSAAIKEEPEKTAASKEEAEKESVVVEEKTEKAPVVTKKEDADEN